MKIFIVILLTIFSIQTTVAETMTGTAADLKISAVSVEGTERMELMMAKAILNGKLTISGGKEKNTLSIKNKDGDIFQGVWIQDNNGPTDILFTVSTETGLVTGRIVFDE